MDRTPVSSDLPDGPPLQRGKADQGARQTVSILSDLNAGAAPPSPPAPGRASRGRWIGMGLMLAAGAGGALFLSRQETPAPRVAAAALPLPRVAPVALAAPSGAVIRELQALRESPAPGAARPAEGSGSLEVQAPAIAARPVPKKAAESRPAARPARPAASRGGIDAAPDSERDVDIVTAIVR